jgi:hypothetical protein
VAVVLSSVIVALLIKGLIESKRARAVNLRREE